MILYRLTFPDGHRLYATGGSLMQVNGHFPCQMEQLDVTEEEAQRVFAHPQDYHPSQHAWRQIPVPDMPST